MPRRKSHKELQELLDAPSSHVGIPPPVQTRTPLLPFGDLTWENFERLCARIIQSNGATYDCYRYGKAGEYQSGIDLLARRWNDGRIERWAYQCKRYERFIPSDVESALKSFKFTADYFVILLSIAAPRAVRDAALAVPNVQVWDAEDLSRILKDQPRIVEDTFGVQWRRAFCGQPPLLLSDSSEAAVRRMIGIDLSHHEWLHSNLLPVSKMPERIYGAALPLNSPRVLTAGEVARIPPVKQTKSMAWTFGEMTNPDVARLIGCNPKDAEWHEVGHFLSWPKQRNWVVELLNKSLQIKCASLGLAYDAGHHRFYFTPENGAERTKRYRAFHRWASRKLAYPYYDKESNELRFWVHHAARLSFAEYGKEFFLRIEPAYAFTKDGAQFMASEDIGPLATRRKSGERNHNVFNHLIFWFEMLSGGTNQIEIDCGGQALVISKVYESATANFGIPSDSAPLVEIAMEEDELDLGLLARENDGEEND